MLINRTASTLATLLRLNAARSTTGKLGPRPDRPLLLYEFEHCPFCRRVREGISDLDLEVEIRPCPKGGTRFRPSVQQKSPRATFPFLIDPNRDVEMFESADILDHIYREYGDGGVPSWLTGPVFLLTSQLASMVRLPWGAARVPSRAPDTPLTLTGFEGDPDARIVREQLCAMELPYVRRNGPDVTLTDAGEVFTGVAAILEHLSSRWRT